MIRGHYNDAVFQLERRFAREQSRAHAGHEAAERERA